MKNFSWVKLIDFPIFFLRFKWEFLKTEFSKLFQLSSISEYVPKGDHVLHCKSTQAQVLWDA